MEMTTPLPFVLWRSEREAVTSPVTKAGRSQRSGRVIFPTRKEGWNNGILLGEGGRMVILIFLFGACFS